MQTERYLDIHEALGSRLLETLPQDRAEGGSPSRDWCRAYGRFQTGIKDLLTEQREGILLRAKLKQGTQLTDEQYNAELLDLGREAVRTLTTDELASALQERGLRAVPVDDVGGDDE